MITLDDILKSLAESDDPMINGGVIFIKKYKLDAKNTAQENRRLLEANKKLANENTKLRKQLKAPKHYAEKLAQWLKTNTENLKP